MIKLRAITVNVNVMVSPRRDVIFWGVSQSVEPRGVTDQVAPVSVPLGEVYLRKDGR